MSRLMLPKQGGNFQNPPPGTHLAVCYRIIDLGTQEKKFKGVVSLKRLIRIQWELPNKLTNEGKPFVVTNRYTLSSSKKSILRQHLEAWLGRSFTEQEFGAFDISEMLRKGCLLNIAHDSSEGEIYVNVKSVMAVPEGMTVPTVINEPFCFSLEAFDQLTFEKLPENTRNMIISSPEYRDLKGLSPPVADEHVSREEELDDSIPF